MHYQGARQDFLLLPDLLGNRYTKSMNNSITVKTTINAPIEKVWEYWTAPEHIVHWAFASDDWETPAAENDVREGGKFKTVMAAKDAHSTSSGQESTSFDFSGVYTVVKEHELIEYDMDDGRHVKIAFTATPEGVTITETFDPEHENSLEVQQGGWQAILENFKKYVEGNT